MTSKPTDEVFAGSAGQRAGKTASRERLLWGRWECFRRLWVITQLLDVYTIG